jgi:threonine/homoserine/homoserine lactone efflux protein
LRWVGAAYLVYVGLAMLHQPRRQFVTDAAATGDQRAAFARGVLTNLLNPKVGVFYVSFLPQFVPADVPVAPYLLLLGAIHAILGLLWFGCLILATRPIARLLRKPAVVQTCDRVTGGLFVAFGLGLALQSRRA